jgi:hypothetical protein
VETLVKRMKRRAAGIEIPGDAPELKETIAKAEAEAPATEEASKADDAPVAEAEAEAKPEEAAKAPAAEDEAAAKTAEEAKPEGESDKQ